MSNSIQIVPYDPAWPDRFAREAAVLREALGEVALRIDHVGSTSVPGLAAKPIVDMQISVARLEPMAVFREPLEQLEYRFKLDPDFPDYPFFGKPPVPPRAYHIHVCAAGSETERRHLAFRDYLRAHPDVADAYAAFKRRIAPGYRVDVHGDREAYADAKSEFILPVQARALAEYAPGG